LWEQASPKAIEDHLLRRNPPLISVAVSPVGMDLTRESPPRATGLGEPGASDERNGPHGEIALGSRAEKRPP
jgi:hypothetical protein